MSTETTDGIVLPVFKSEGPEYAPVIPMTGETDVMVVEPVDEVRQRTVSLVEPIPNPVDYVKRQRPKTKSSRPQEDPDKFLLQAKALVVQNYNEHRDPRRSPMLNMDLVYITTFTKTLSSWKAIVGSTVVRGLMWEVTFNGEKNENDEPKNEAYIDIYKKLNHVKIPLGE